MPFYKAQDMQATPDVVNPNVMMMQFGGEFIKVGIVTYEAGEAPPPHSHPLKNISRRMLIRLLLPLRKLRSDRAAS